ncbi:putative membrane protein [Anaplasma phagocytophilum str. ApNP]|uniref:Putative membrane protein n=1 Tax=Anaplasma phagocytophilum str. ApNP TaxID=1359153 RepID=A0A0F3NG76_ANAPH|nr:putative membrane protein [Anaplasma phagocytophilum str. ApNP]
MLRDFEIECNNCALFLNFGIASLSTLNITFMHCKRLFV